MMYQVKNAEKVNIIGFNHNGTVYNIPAGESIYNVSDEGAQVLGKNYPFLQIRKQEEPFIKTNELTSEKEVVSEETPLKKRGRKKIKK